MLEQISFCSKCFGAINPVVFNSSINIEDNLIKKKGDGTEKVHLRFMNEHEQISKTKIEYSTNMTDG